MRPLVSIIIPVYNGSNYLSEAIDSALAQTYKEIEIIVVNDGSDDGFQTRDIALSYGNKIRYYEKENGGVSTALNYGVQMMKGEYFSWLSHDDLYLPGKIETEIAALDKIGDKTTPVYCGWYKYNMDTGDKTIYSDYEEKYSSYYFTYGTSATVIGLISGCGLLIHKSYFDKYGWFDEKSRITQDYDMWFRMFRGKRLKYINSPLIISRVHKAQVTTTDKSYLDECDKFDCFMIDNLNESDLLGMECTLYGFLSLAMIIMGNQGHNKAYKHIQNRLRDLEEPEDAISRRNNLRQYLYKKLGEKVFLFCMGKRGVTLLEALKMRGIEVCGFSDSDSHKHNCNLNGIQGCPLDKIPKGAGIIVTKEKPHDLAEELKEKGYTNVSTYNEIEQLVMETPVDKRILLTCY